MSASNPEIPPKAELVGTKVPTREKNITPEKGQTNWRNILNLSEKQRNSLKDEIKTPKESDEKKDKVTTAAYEIARVCNERIKSQGPQGCIDVFYGVINVCISLGLYHGTNEDGKNLRKDLTTEQKEDNSNVELYAQVLIMSILKSRRITLLKEGGKPVLDIPSDVNSGHIGRNKEDQNKWGNLDPNFLSKMGITSANIDQVVDGMKKNAKPGELEKKDKPTDTPTRTPPERSAVSTFLREKPYVALATIAGGAAALGLVGFLIYKAFKNKDDGGGHAGHGNAPSGAPSGQAGHDHGFGINLWHIILAAGLGAGVYFGYKEVRRLEKKFDAGMDVVNDLKGNVSDLKGKMDNVPEYMKKEFDKLKGELAGKKPEKPKKTPQILNTEQRKYRDKELRDAPFKDWNTSPLVTIKEQIKNEGPVEAMKELKKLRSKTDHALDVTVLVGLGALATMIAMESALARVDGVSKNTNGVPIKPEDIQNLLKEVTYDNELKDINITTAGIQDKLNETIKKNNFDHFQHRDILEPIMRLAVSRVCGDRIMSLLAFAKDTSGNPIDVDTDMFSEQGTGITHSWSWLQEQINALEEGEKTPAEVSESINKIVNTSGELILSNNVQISSIPSASREYVQKIIPLIEWLKNNY